MKKIIVLLFACVLASAASYAQQGPGGQSRTPEERAKMTVEWMTKELSLNADQATKVTGIQTDYFKAMEKMRSEGRPDREAFKKMNDERDEKLKGVLTEDQFKKYTEKQEEMRKNRGGRGPGGGGPGGRK
ncbi:hypothetical protein LX64_01584 [Chitinophaga skermanii]|uniref:DUF4890 domain-containing protein n=1 Tax=Chitinophaga skermanii TaxID=331697 RepID=A0A327QWF0_9BACT|nr:hypothetical protein [Chitinophaga skermanii]RAJ08929.1 hypothetical protein LX64_01584 [Chitinophaga skermanii]